ncbi:MAG: hypothetical protein ACLPT4_12875 [Verrucomicrobiia bacterium]
MIIKQLNTRRVIAVLSSVVCIWLALSTTTCFGGETVEPGRAVLDKLLKAIETNDHDAVMAVDGTDGFKAALTKESLAGASGQLSPRMKKGYQCLYLGELKQHGTRVLLWKLVFKDGGDDTLARLILKDGKVAGFGLQ